MTFNDSQYNKYDHHSFNRISSPLYSCPPDKGTGYLDPVHLCTSVSTDSWDIFLLFLSTMPSSFERFVFCFFVLYCAVYSLWPFNLLLVDSEHLHLHTIGDMGLDSVLEEDISTTEFSSNFCFLTELDAFLTVPDCTLAIIEGCTSFRVSL